MNYTINTDAVKEHADRLRQMHKKALPNTIRETLSKSALNVKQKTMPVTAKKAFKERSKNFFKANSKVNFAKGFNVNTMSSSVGFMEDKLKKKDTNFAVKDLEQQEHGGKIKGRSFIPMNKARTGKSPNKLVSKKNRLSDIKNDIIRASRIKSGVGKKQAWIRAAIMAKKLHGDNAFVLGDVKNGKRTLSRIDSISTNLKTRKLVIKRTPIYTYVKGRAVKVSEKQFMKRASFETQSNMKKIFIEEAEKQFKRYNK